MRRFSPRSALGALVVLAAAGTIWVQGGDLNPPAGPVAPTMKSLAEVEPRIAVNAANTPGDPDSLFKITQPGSYYLTGNVAGVTGKHGIEIAASGVTLDLNGFDLVGVAGSLDGVSVTVFSQTNIAVVNGSVRSWGDEGVDLGSFAGLNCRVADVLASGNTGNGIAAGFGGTVSNCLALNNAVNGISTSSGSTVTNCSVLQNTGSGISTGNVCTVTNCSALQNSGNGIATGVGCTVTNCSALLNLANGIATSSGSTVSNCSARQNSANGINASLACTVTNCSATSNAGDGISAADGSTVADCTVHFNTLDGIRCSVSCVIRGNTCSTNGFGAGDGAGIHATSTNNRIEGNNCTVADRGIDVDIFGNIIIRNTCSGNDIDWVISTNNIYGPIIDRRTPASAAVSGFGAVTTLGTTDPNANFSY